MFGRPPAFSRDHFVPLALVAADPTIVVVNADLPWKSVKELLEDAKKRPGEITFSSSGIYGALHMPMEMFAAIAGVKLLHVPYTGAGPAVIALLGGNIDAIASGPSTVIQHVKAGKLRVLASWGEQRLASLPDVPTLTESGISVVFFQWAALFAPAATPEPTAYAVPRTSATPARAGDAPTHRRTESSRRRYSNTRSVVPAMPIAAISVATAANASNRHAR